VSRILPLELADVRYQVGDTPLIKGISVTLETGARSVILGPNGAGKSLFLRLCHGLIRPTAGSIRWRGPEGDRAERYQAMVFQRPVLLRRSVRANVAYALSVRRVSRHERPERTMAALEMAGLADLADRSARVLSGGEQQHLAIARAWAVAPEVMFLDEPTSQLDPAATRNVENVVNRIAATGTKVVMTTHDLAQARRMADEILFLNQGRLLEKTAASEFFGQPKTREASAFLAGDLLW